MALNNNEKQITALLAQKKPEVEYMIRLSSDEPFAKQEITDKSSGLKEELLKEKESHESHISMLTTRLEKISLLISAIEDLQNGNE